MQQAFLNAFGQQPTTTEQQTWERNLSFGRITEAQFVVVLARSIEKLSAGNTHVSITVSITAYYIGAVGDETRLASNGQDLIGGFACDDILKGVRGTDVLIGGTGDDVLNGGDGNEVLIFAISDKAANNWRLIAMGMQTIAAAWILE